MYIITATFDADAAFARVTELLNLGDSPERLAERLGTPRDLDQIKKGVQVSSFRQLMGDVRQLKRFVDINTQIDAAKNGKSAMRFLGAGYTEKQVSKLEAEREKLGSLLEAPKWFYEQPRVHLLSAIRDYALDGSQQGDAAWLDVEVEKLDFPIAAMFEKADAAFAETLMLELEKPLKDVDPRFVLEKFEGNRSITFDFDKGVVLYYSPAPSTAG